MPFSICYQLGLYFNSRPIQPRWGRDPAHCLRFAHPAEADWRLEANAEKNIQIYLNFDIQEGEGKEEERKEKGENSKQNEKRKKQEEGDRRKEKTEKKGESLAKPFPQKGRKGYHGPAGQPFRRSRLKLTFEPFRPVCTGWQCKPRNPAPRNFPQIRLVCTGMQCK